MRTDTETGADLVTGMITPNDCLAVSEEGDLLIEGMPARSLADQFGTPLYVISEAAIRGSYRRIEAAFSRAWPSRVRVLYAIKANNNQAVRQLLALEGAGSDCFGEAELYASFLGGADPNLVVVNGSNKSPEEIRRAVALGVRINIDAEEEIDLIAQAAHATDRLGRVALRLKVAPDDLASGGSDYFAVPAGLLSDFLEREKWGFSLTGAIPLLKDILQRAELRLEGYSTHVGRFSADPQTYALWARGLARMVVSLGRELSYWPATLNLGGGWPRERDPESRLRGSCAAPIEEYAEAVCAALRVELLNGDAPPPELWLESGRYVVGNAAVLLGRVGAIKRDCGRVWVNVDASTNNLMRRDTSESAYAVVPAERLREPLAETVDVVGPTCVESRLGDDVRMPILRRGDLIAVLDAGMYAETTSTQFNGLPRPATVLVGGDQVDLIKERETLADVFEKHRIPERLRIAFQQADG